MRNKIILVSSLMLVATSTLSSCNKNSYSNITKCNLGNAISLMTGASDVQSLKMLKSNGQSNGDLLGAINKIDADCNITELEFTDDAGNVHKLDHPGFAPVNDKYMLIPFKTRGMDFILLDKQTGKCIYLNDSFLISHYGHNSHTNCYTDKNGLNYFRAWDYEKSSQSGINSCYFKSFDDSLNLVKRYDNKSGYRSFPYDGSFVVNKDGVIFTNVVKEDDPLTINFEWITPDGEAKVKCQFPEKYVYESQCMDEKCWLGLDNNLYYLHFSYSPSLCNEIYRIDYDKEKNDVTFVKLYENDYDINVTRGFEVMHTDSIQLIPTPCSHSSNMFLKLDYNKIDTDDFVTEINLSNSLEATGCTLGNDFYGVVGPVKTNEEGDLLTYYICKYDLSIENPEPTAIICSFTGTCRRGYDSLHPCIVVAKNKTVFYTYDCVGKYVFAMLKDGETEPIIKNYSEGTMPSLIAL